MSRGRRTALVIIALVVVPLMVVASGVVWFWWQLDPPGSAGRKVEVQIAQHWGVAKIGDELHHDGVIDSSFVFSLYSRLNGDTEFQAGTYDLRKHMGVRAAVKALKAGPTRNYVTLTIPPGFWMKEIAARVAKLPGVDIDTFLQSAQNNAVRSTFEPDGVNSLEGLLWPDTYKIDAEEDEIQILKTMSDTFQTRATSLGLVNANVHGLGAYDIIKVASLIEAEAKVNSERPLIASVIYNRLARNMPLQIDATLIYARGDPKKRSLSNADKLIDSPFNTYSHLGLPPTPIAAVSAESLKAALAPASTDYLFYVLSDKQGHHAFSATEQEQEHNIEIARQKGLL